jgi:hypothetical protein
MINHHWPAYYRRTFRRLFQAFAVFLNVGIPVSWTTEAPVLIVKWQIRHQFQDPVGRDPAGNLPASHRKSHGFRSRLRSIRGLQLNEGALSSITSGLQPVVCGSVLLLDSGDTCAALIFYG